MIQIILLIAAIFALIHLPKVKRRTAANYPSVSPEKFKLWHEADLKATIAFVIATWGALALQIVILVIGGYIKHRIFDYNNENIDMALIIITFAAFLIPLFWPAILGSKAARLKKEASIGREVIVDIQEETESKVSGLVIVGLVCAIIGLIIPLLGIAFGSIGFILGFVAINKINRSSVKIKRKGMAIAAVIVGVVAIVLHIILILLTFSAYTRTRERAKISATLGTMNTIRTAIELYKLDTGSYPQDLSTLIPNSTGGNTYLKELPKDAWSRDYIYRVKSDESFELFSLGPDGIGGNKDDVKLSNF